MERTERMKSVILDFVGYYGRIDGEKLNTKNPALREQRGENGMLAPTVIAGSYWQRHLQYPSAWSFEIHLRPFKESF